MPDGSCVLIVEDEYLIAAAVRQIMHELKLGLSHVAQTVEDAIKAAKEYKPLLIIMDLELKGNGDGVDAAIRIHKDQSCPIIFTTGHSGPAALQRIFQDHPTAIVKKPFSAEELKRAIRTALQVKNVSNALGA